MGRNKEFNEDEVLRRAMELFWERGYENTSMNDLVEHMGIHRKSLYDTFGDKHTLYLRAFDNYAEYVTSSLKFETSQAKTAKQAIQYVFDAIIENNSGKRWGCFFVNAVAEMMPRDKDIEKKATEAFINAEHFLSEIIDKGQREGEFSESYTAEALAEFLHNTLVGLRILAKTAESKEKMCRIRDFFLVLLCK